MTIKVPTYVLKYGFNDHELVFSAFMLYLLAKENKHTKFYMWSDDIKRILGHTKKTNNKRLRRPVVEEYRERDGLAMGYLERVLKAFEIGFVDYHTWSVRYIPHTEYEFRNGNIHNTDIEITDQKAINIYYYLVGRINGQNIIEKGRPKLGDNIAIKSTVVVPFFKKHFEL